jgi:NitT/TauT family transport system substrate-binding protein
VLDYILAQNGLTPGTDVTVEYMTADEVVAHMLAGDADLCMLPVPYTTALLLKDANVRTALSLSDAWENTGAGSKLTQGCIVMRNGALDEKTVTDFLTAYGESIAYMTDAANLDAAAALAVKHEIVGSEPIARAAIPASNIVFITGADALKTGLEGYYEVLYAADPTSIGGAIPDDDIYYNYQG